jgi:hypothetical protein
VSEEGAEPKGPGGRPSKYRPEFPTQAEKLCKLGATDAEIAEFFEVDVRTINRWKHDHDEFCQSLKRGKEVADEAVERSLFQRATGYSHDAVKIFQVEGKPLVVPLVEHYPPDTTACIFWLKNRKSDEWRDKVQVGGDPENPLQTITRVELVAPDVNSAG